jgi:transcriptional regulator with XRE-family HTH domain
VSLKAIEKIEQGLSRGSPKTAFKLATALEVSMADMVDALMGDYITEGVVNDSPTTEVESCG